MKNLPTIAGAQKFSAPKITCFLIEPTGGINVLTADALTWEWIPSTSTQNTAMRPGFDRAGLRLVGQRFVAIETDAVRLSYPSRVAWQGALRGHCHRELFLRVASYATGTVF